MNTDNNQRYQDTEVLIQDTFGSLIQEKSINKITVKDICDRAGIHRTTFYTHFKDMEDLQEKSQLLQIEKFFSDYKTSGKFNIREKLKEQISFLYEYRHVLKKQYDRGDYEQLCNMLMGDQPAIPAELLEKLTDVQQKKAKYTGDFFSAGYNRVLIEWIRSGCDMDIDDLVDTLCSIYESNCDVFHGK